VFLMKKLGTGYSPDRQSGCLIRFQVRCYPSLKNFMAVPQNARNGHLIKLVTADCENGAGQGQRLYG
jgi:hypothetical protein